MLNFKEDIIPTTGNYSKDKIYYIYVYMDPRKPGIWFYNNYIFTYEPFYIGKGKGKRLYDHLKLNKSNIYKNRKIKKILNTNQTPIIGKIFNNLLEEEALFLEEDVILNLGIYKCLTNFTIGYKYNINKKEMSKRISEANKKSYRENPERAKKHSKRMKGSGNPMFGMERSEGTKEKIRETKRRWKELGINNKKYIDIDKEKVILLNNLKFNLKQIAFIFNCSKDVIIDRLKKWGIKKTKISSGDILNLLNRDLLFSKFKNKEVCYEQLIEKRKQFNTK